MTETGTDELAMFVGTLGVLIGGIMTALDAQPNFREQVKSGLQKQLALRPQLEAQIKEAVEWVEKGIPRFVSN